MGKRILNVLLFMAVACAGAMMTVYVGKGAVSMLIYNFVFFGIMVLFYIIGMAMGMFRLNDISDAIARGTQEITDIFKLPGKASAKDMRQLKGIFDNKFLDGQMDSFLESMEQSREGIGDVEDYINEDEIDLRIHKRLLELVPDIFTSLGILGTFVGLVWGLKNFEPSSYDTMTNSVAVLVEGIKVAFLTSIYGISFSIIYTMGMKSCYTEMTERLQTFLSKFHSFVLPSAENEARNLLVSSQKVQVKAMEQMAEQFSVKMADSFEKVITPTFQKMNDSLDVLVTTATRSQQDAVRELVDSFMKEMNSSFRLQFSDFNQAIEQLKDAQKDNTDYTAALYQTMSRQLSDTYLAQDKAMKNYITELGSMQNRYMSTASRIVKDNQEIQKMQQQDYQHITDYLREAEKSSAKFWVACNQTMQKYVETAAQGMEKASYANQLSGDLVKANKRIIEDFGVKMQEFVEYQKLSYRTMDQVRRLLADISVAGEPKDIYLTGGKAAGEQASKEQMELLGKLLGTIAEQGVQQEQLLEQLNQSIRELSRKQQKGKGGIFK